MGGADVDIQVLGNAWARDAHGERREPKHKAMTLLAYLALEGATAREKLVGLLWPDATTHAAGLGNLRQALLRMRRLLEVDYVQGGDYLTLREGLVVDVQQLLAAHDKQDFERVVSFKGELLHGFTYNDENFAELNAWLVPWRLKLYHLQLNAWEELVRGPEREGRLKEALERARQLLEWEPRSESSYRHVMHLLYRLGDRPAALKAYRHCLDMLKREDVPPSPETLALARQIERVDAPLPKPVVPLSVVHPPVFAGREREWASMEEAWAARQPMIVTGEPGAGKSRLVQEFGHSRGGCLLIHGRPGDQKLPYSTHIRNLTELLRDRPDFPMQPWIRRELSRLLPWLQDDPLPLPRSPEERTRLFSAVIELLPSALRDVDVIVFDDAQYMDRDSAELGIQIHAVYREEMKAGRFPLIINVFRTSEAGEWEQKQIQAVIDNGLMCLVPVGRLDIQAVTQMLRGMGEPEQAAEKLMAYTGGNPLFIVETVRHLRRSGNGDGKFPEALAPPQRLRVMIEQSLERLSPEALRLVRLFAVARTDFSAELASKVLEVPVDQLVAPWKELEEVGLIQGKWFVHDLVAEVVLATVPEPIRDELNRWIDFYRGTH